MVFKSKKRVSAAANDLALQLSQWRHINKLWPPKRSFSNRTPINAASHRVLYPRLAALIRGLTLALLFLCLLLHWTSKPTYAQATDNMPATPGDAIFRDVSVQAGVTTAQRASWDEMDKSKVFTDGYMAIGQAWGDYDRDGFVDLYVTGNLTASVLYHNNGDGTFRISPFSTTVSLPRVQTGGATWADYDNDGWKDLYVVAHGANVLFHNDAGKGFTDVTAKAGVGDPGKGTSSAWGDYDNDGYLDLYVVNWSCYPKCKPVDHKQAQDRLYHNNRDGTFTDVSNFLDYDQLLGAGFAATFVDYDNDGDLDLYVVNDMLQNPIGNILWRNDGSGCSGWCWTDVSKESGAYLLLHGMGIAVGDYNNDGNLDLYVTEMVNPMVLLQNQGDGTFKKMDEKTGVGIGPSSGVGWGTEFFDYNNDGWLDLYVATTEFVQFDVVSGPKGMFFKYPNYFFENKGDGTFRDMTPQAWRKTPRPSMGVAYADYDNDGLVDFVEGNWNEGYNLYHNEGLAGKGNHWLTVRLTGDGPVNRDALGARVYLTTDDGRTQMQDVRSGSSLGSGSDTALHFGLGNANIKLAKVVWPNGKSVEYENVARDQIWQVRYPEKETHRPQLPVASSRSEPFVEVGKAAGLTAKHRGFWDMFNKEFKSGYLGVGQAWGDYDNDGLVDLYVTGNLTDSVLYHNAGNGKFSVSPFAAQLALSGVKTGGAIWADYDNDGWKDLYVLVQGANHLFHNAQGKGFTDVTAQAGVGDAGKGSSATWGDYDNDGYLDLYVVNWSCYPECNPLNNELAQDRLYHNNHNGTFTDVSGLLTHEKLLGAGFAAAFVDYDSDGDVDLYVVNDELKNPIGNVLWRNDGPGCAGWCWTDVSAATETNIKIAGMGLAVGDYNADLYPDFYFTNMVNPMALLQNQAGANFKNVTEQAGVALGPSSAVAWGTAFLDYDNDGWLDLLATSTQFVQYDVISGPKGMHDPYPNSLFHNDGQGAFRDVTPASWIEAPHTGMGLAYADYDNDGWLDFVVGNWNEGYALYRNQALTSKTNHWLALRLEGSGTINRDAIGARAYIVTSDQRVQMQAVVCGGSLGAGNDTVLHFGLGQATVKQVTIIWPNGEMSFYNQVPVDQFWQVKYN